MKRYYHFTSDKLRDGRPIPPIGEWLEHDGPVIPCKSGLHAAEHPFDALEYAPGPILHIVELDGDIVAHDVYKVVASRRRIVASIDSTDLLRAFARWCALQVVPLWNAPETVVEYLKTGDAAWDAAWAAARAATRAATWDAAWAATRAATWAATRAATWDAAWDATRAKQRNKFLELTTNAFNEA